jgi:glycine dehydrogenase subunit 1
MRYIPLSDSDRKEMLSTIGVSSTGELFDSIPKDLRLGRQLKLRDAMPEEGTLAFMKTLAGNNNPASANPTFLGAGSYNHFIPAAIDQITGRSEWYSAYTPYQPEISQGTLQAIYEFQSYVCGLLGMEVANASMYDGASAMAEAILMAARISKKNEIVVSNLVHPRWREVSKTFVSNRGIKLVETDDHLSGRVDVANLEKSLTENTGAVVVQSPNFFGNIEDLQAIGELCKERELLFIVGVAEALSLGLLKPPGEFGADIVVGEGQSLGLPQSYGGPYLGLFATRRKFLRQMPGRLSGKTKDGEGRDGFVLTLVAREQHIRREKATSNICTNQALCALRATMYLSLLGKSGLADMAKANFNAAVALRKKIAPSKKISATFKHPFFNETVVTLKKDPGAVNAKLAKAGIVGGLDLSRFYPDMKKSMLLAVTELTAKDDIDTLVKKMGG